MLTHAGEDEGTTNHEDGLRKVGPDDCGEASGHGEDAGNGQQNDDSDVNGVLAFKLRGLGNE